MTALPSNLQHVDWSRTTFDGARREQLAAWSRAPLVEVIATLEEMTRLESQPAGAVDQPDDPVLIEVVRRMVETYAPERIYLFGSRARDDASTDSDCDLLIVVPDSAPPEHREAGLAHLALWGAPAAVDAVVCSSSWFDARTHLAASLPGTVLREGRLLHATLTPLAKEAATFDAVRLEVPVSGDWLEPSVEEAEAVLALAHAAVKAVQSRLPAVARS